MKICEIDYASGIPPLHIDLAQTIQVGTIENQQVFGIEDSQNEIYMFIVAEKVTTYIAVSKQEINGHHCLRRLENISAPKGSITALCVFLISKKNYKLVIDKSEPLTYAGLNWIVKLIQSGGRGMKISDEFGKMPDVNSLVKEWENTRINYSPGSTSIFIENKNIPGAPLFETYGFVKPAYKFLYDLKID